MKYAITFFVLFLSVLLGAQPSISGENEVLYNGIHIPSEWPPRTQEMDDVAPMQVPYLENPPEVIPISIGRQLFVDDFLIEKTNLVRVYHRAKTYHDNPVFHSQTKYELDTGSVEQANTYLGHGGVFYNPDKSRYEMYYTAGWRGAFALATSTDIFNWSRPELDLFDENIILPAGWMTAGGDNSIWLDLNAEDSLERYKLLVDRGTHQRPVRRDHTLHTSPNGLVWSQGVSTGKAGDYTSFFYNPFREKWIFSIKGKGRDRSRARFYSENDDFLKGADWSNSVFWIGADSLDLADPEVGDPAQLYSLNAVAYESIILGEFYIHRGPENKVCEEGKYPKITELQLGYSRDGFHWYRPERKSFIPATQQKGDWDRAYIHGTAGVCLVTEKKIWFPYCGFSGQSPTGSEGMYTGASIGLASLRRDGFASMQTETTGTLTTRKVTFDGEYLFVNANCSSGELHVEILDHNDRVIKPFSAKNCKPIRLNETKTMVTWKRDKSLASLTGKEVKFRFHLTRGELYSFWVSTNESGTSNGFLGAGSNDYNSLVDSFEFNPTLKK